ncbi:MAG: carbohydrate-binding protein [Verrucomicrobiae bacterium]|nr:carbohydrate-binding protein [Verrucomicrobiae bacterium]
MKTPASITVRVSGLITLVSLLLPALSAFAAEEKSAPAEESAAPSSNLPPDPFANIETPPVAKAYTMEVDRERGKVSVEATDGTYQEGSHFAHWMWKFDAKRWGRYFVRLRYTSTTAKIGVQVKIGEQVVKSYAPRTGGHEPHQVNALILGYIYVEKPGEYPLVLLTGDRSKGPSFFVKGVDLIPAPENGDDGVAQSIDGTIELLAKSATTFSQNMRYEPKAEKNCLGFWTDENDWAEWAVDVANPGKYRIEVVQGCGDGNGGSEVALLVNENTFKFQVEETGGFQNWKSRQLGIVEIPHAGEHRIALKPLTKSGKAVMDIQKVVLTPVQG